MSKKETALAASGTRDPFALLRQMTSDFDRFFDEPFGIAFKWPPLRGFEEPGAATSWVPKVDVFEKDNRLVTKVDLPGLKKEDVHVEIADGYLAISGERKNETEEKKEQVYRCERTYGSFYRAVPLPERVNLEDVKATFADGVLEVSIPLPAKVAPAPLKVPIGEAPLAKSAAV